MRDCICGNKNPQCFLVLINKRIQQKLLQEVEHNQIILDLGSLHEGNAKGFVVSNKGYALLPPPTFSRVCAKLYVIKVGVL